MVLKVIPATKMEIFKYRHFYRLQMIHPSYEDLYENPHLPVPILLVDFPTDVNRIDVT